MEKEKKGKEEKSISKGEKYLKVVSALFMNIYHRMKTNNPNTFIG